MIKEKEKIAEQCTTFEGKGINKIPQRTRRRRRQSVRSYLYFIPFLLFFLRFDPIRKNTDRKKNPPPTDSR